VYSYRNSSYTLLVTTTHDAIITLAPNRPQVVHVRDAHPIRVQYFKLLSHNGAEDITVSLTNEGSSHAVMVMEKYVISSYNGSLPDPTDPHTYSYSTLHSGGESLFAPGPNNQPVIYVVGVLVNQPTSYSILMSSSSLPVILRSGVPQLNYVQQGAMAQFIFFFHEPVDIQVTITALSGDPDLFISERAGDQGPTCLVDQDMYWRVKCVNYTWYSTSYSTDQIIISKDLPCSPVMPGTSIRTDCDPSLYGTSPLRIGVYGYSTSRFMITTSIRGEHLTLLPGKPQLSITSPAVVCSNRNPLNGVCIDHVGSTSVFAAYFTYSVSNRYASNPSTMNNNAIYITVKPVCNTSVTAHTSASASTSMTGSCSPGCDCDPIAMYVLSCPASKCTASDKYPSYLTGHYKGHMDITSSSNSLLISTFTPSLYCNPSITGETCIYYIALITKQTKTHIPFTINIQNPDDVLVVSCDATPSPDGYRLSKLVTNPLAPLSSPQGGSSGLLSSSISYGKYYELCSTSTFTENKERLVVSIEQCVGTSRLYACSNDACDSFLPSEQSWEYYADSTQSCQSQSQSLSTSSHPLPPLCQTTPGGSLSQPSLSLPEQHGNYHIKVNGTGRYVINIQTTLHGELIEPKFMFDQLTESKGIQLLEHTTTSLTFSWSHIGILMPGESRPKKTINTVYYLYLFEETQLVSLALDYKSNYHLPLVLDTKCGLDYTASLLSESKIIAIPAVGSETNPSLTHTISGLKQGMSYVVYLLAQCDGSCLRQLSKTMVSTHYVSCGGGAVDCMTQKYYFGSILAQTSGKGSESSGSSNEGSSSSSSSSSSVDNLVLIVVLCLLALLSFLFGVFSYYYRNKKQLDEIQAFEMVDFNSTNGSESGGGGFGSSSHSSKQTPFFGFFEQPLTTPGPSSGSGRNSSSGIGGGKTTRSSMSRVKLPTPATSSFFSKYSPLIKDEDQDEEEEVTINL
jgi:hypothetical protein